jgi:hypothetical protein
MGFLNLVFWRSETALQYKKSAGYEMLNTASIMNNEKNFQVEFFLIV